MRFLYSFFLLLLFNLITSCNLFEGKSNQLNEYSADITEVDKLIKIAYEKRMTKPEQTVIYADKALVLAKRINYLFGAGEAYRVKGIGKSYQNQSAVANENYLNALTYFKKSQNLEGEAKVYNNIANLYRNANYDKSLVNLNKSLSIALRLDIKGLLASLYGNLGDIYQKKKHYTLALSYFEKSKDLFIELEDPTGLTQYFQNVGVIYYKQNKLDKSEQYLQEAIRSAQKNNEKKALNSIIAGSNLTLALIYIAENRFKDAENAIQEGIKYSKIIKDGRLEYEYLYKLHELESKRKNYQKALGYLKQVHFQDSLNFANSVSEQIDLQAEQYHQQEKQKENELTILKLKNTAQLLWASSVVAGLAIIVVCLLVINARKTAIANKELKRLNQEVSEQKEDLDRINQNLEELIDERTKDLQIKNKKLSQYSSHLSHQIRGPVATIKGLMILEKDKLIDQEEFIDKMDQCIFDIDDKIIHINEMLNNATKTSLK